MRDEGGDSRFGLSNVMRSVSFAYAFEQATAKRRAPGFIEAVR
jgi:hypothetical protein